jgi:hydroxyacyl-ACP dehydratase HTD2-like protein with hotdog domain
MALDHHGIAAGDRIPEFAIRPTLRHAVMYAAAMWEFQRIHYDERWAREEEGLPGAVVQGPVLGNYLVQALARWTGRGAALRRLSWRNHGLVVFGDDIRCVGQVTAARIARNGGAESQCVECSLEMLNQRGEKVVSATAQLEFALAAPGAPGAAR